MKAHKRQARKLPLPDTPTLTLRLDSGDELVLDRITLPTPGMPPGALTVQYAGHGFLVLITRSTHPEHGPLLHASMSHTSGALPAWAAMKALKKAVFPDNVAAMLPLPEDSAYVNIAEALHLVQTPSNWIGL